MGAIDKEKYMRFQELLCLENPALAVFYTDEEPEEGMQPPEGNQTVEIIEEYRARNKVVPFEEIHRHNKCMISYVNRVLRKGGTVYFDKDHYGCLGGAHTMGFNPGASEAAAHVISTGIPEILEGEHIFRSPESAKRHFEEQAAPDAPAKYLVIKRLEDLKEGEEAEVIVLIEEPDVIAGLFGLLVYSLDQRSSVIAPFGAGCAGIITNPMKEAASDNSRAVLGMLDVAARPEIDPRLLSLSIPAKILPRLLEDMDDSFLKGHSWKRISERVRKGRDST